MDFLFGLNFILQSPRKIELFLNKNITIINCGKILNSHIIVVIGEVIPKIRAQNIKVTKACPRPNLEEKGGGGVPS